MKGIKLAVLVVILVIFSLQATQVFAGNDDKSPITGPVTNPITSPITSPLCKPGFGFGDKNHCHFGPPGHFDFGKFEKDLQKNFSDEFNNVIKGFHNVFHF